MPTRDKITVSSARKLDQYIREAELVQRLRRRIQALAGFAASESGSKTDLERLCARSCLALHGRSIATTQMRSSCHQPT